MDNADQEMTSDNGSSSQDGSNGDSYHKSYNDEGMWLEEQLNYLSKEYGNLEDTENKLLSMLHRLQQDEERIANALDEMVDEDGASISNQQQQSQRNQKEREALEIMEQMLMMDDDDESDANDSDD